MMKTFPDHPKRGQLLVLQILGRPDPFPVEIIFKNGIDSFGSMGALGLEVFKKKLTEMILR